jgi:transaldolase
VPDATLDAFRDAPDPAPDRFTVLDDVDWARADLAALAEAGVDLDEITAELERAGVQQFADAYAQMLDAIARKRQRIAVA